MRKKLVILALAIAAAIPGASLADPNKECPGGPPGHCKTAGGGGKNSQQQQQQQEQSQRQCIIVIGLLQPANC